MTVTIKKILLPGSAELESPRPRKYFSSYASLFVRGTRTFIMVLLTALSVLSLLHTTVAWPSPPQQQTLQFTKDGTFQLCVFEDLHFGEAEDLDWGPQQDINTTRVMNNVLNSESPQLVVLNGDLITGENTFLSNSTLYVDRIVQPMVQRGLSWASTYGNHDSQFNLSRSGILAREQRYPNSLTQQMVHTPNAGVSNYYLPVFGPNTSPWDRNAVPEMILWFFDSRGGFLFQQSDTEDNTVPQPDWVDETVVDWFTAMKKSLSSQYHNASIPSLAFVHIPVDAMLAFQAGPGVKPHKEPGINQDVPLAQQGQGWASDTQLGTSDAYAGQDVPFMSALLDTPDLMGVFSGHDHGDDWCFKWARKLPGMNLTGNGLDLCFGRHTGYGGYGSWTRGGRQIVIDLGKVKAMQGVETYIRLEDGTESGRVMLNGTYSKDRYPAVPVTYSS
jgi:hypothetical protein